MVKKIHGITLLGEANLTPNLLMILTKMKWHRWSLSYCIRKTTKRRANIRKTKIKHNVNAHPQTKEEGDKANLNKINRRTQINKDPKR